MSNVQPQIPGEEQWSPLAWLGIGTGVSVLMGALAYAVIKDDDKDPNSLHTRPRFGGFASMASSRSEADRLLDQARELGVDEFVRYRKRFLGPYERAKFDAAVDAIRAEGVSLEGAVTAVAISDAPYARTAHAIVQNGLHMAPAFSDTSDYARLQTAHRMMAAMLAVPRSD
jgi:hypothetical protein